MKKLFQTSISEILKQREQQLADAVKRMSEDELAHDIEDLVEQLACEYDFPDVPEVQLEKMCMEDVEFEEDQPNCIAKMHIPYSGDGLAFELYDTSCSECRGLSQFQRDSPRQVQIPLGIDLCDISACVPQGHLSRLDAKLLPNLRGA